MDLLKTDIKKLFFRYLAAAFGSALISSIYGIVDMAMVGQYQGPNGTAALAAVAPVWNILYSLGLMFGIGGTVLFSKLRGESKENEKRSNEYFTISIMLTILFSLLSFLVLYFFQDSILTFFGADSTLLPLAKNYLKPVLWVAPLFLFNQQLAAFLRNDNDPLLATIAVLAGGVFNVFGDWFFVFFMNWGIYGAGFATSLGALITFICLLIHFIKKKNTLKFVKPTKIFKKSGMIIEHGFPVFIVDFAMGIMTVVFNRQIGKFLGNDALSVYGIIINVSTIVTCCSYSIGQAAQPIFSSNFGAGNKDRIKETLKYSLIVCAAFSIFWTVLSIGFPTAYIKLFMKPTDEVLKIGPTIIRLYSTSFLLLTFNVFSTYYFESLTKAKISLSVSVLRGVILSVIFIEVFPYIFPVNSLWLSMTAVEALTFAFVVYEIIKQTKRLPEKSKALNQ